MTDLLADIARIAPLQPGCIEQDRLFLYPTLDAAAWQVCQALLQRHGVRPGDRVAVLAGRSWRWIPLLFGIFRAGAIAAPLNLRLPPAALRQRLDTLAPRLLVRDDAREGLFAEFSSAALEGLCSDTLHEQGHPPADIELEAPATLLFSSGSLGHPRAFVHSYANHYFSALGAQRHLRLTVGDRWLLSLPLYHVGGLGILFRCLLGGASVVIPREEATLAEDVREFSISHLSLVPTQLRRMLAEGAPRRHLKRVLLGGAPLDPTLLAKARDAGLPVTATSGLPQPAPRGPGGEPGEGGGLPPRALRVGAGGEIRVRGDVLCLGEWREGDIVPLTEPGGWYATGDLGEVRGGVLHVGGRKDNQFISGGENIHPEAIERLLPECTGATQAVVTPLDDPEFGQRPCAWLDLPEHAFRPDEWARALRAQLPGYMIPVAWRVLPPSEGLKPDRARLRNAGGLTEGGGGGKGVA